MENSREIIKEALVVYGTLFLLVGILLGYLFGRSIHKPGTRKAVTKPKVVQMRPIRNTSHHKTKKP